MRLLGCEARFLGRGRDEMYWLLCIRYVLRAKMNFLFRVSYFVSYSNLINLVPLLSTTSYISLAPLNSTSKIEDLL